MPKQQALDLRSWVRTIELLALMPVEELQQRQVLALELLLVPQVPLQEQGPGQVLEMVRPRQEPQL